MDQATNQSERGHPMKTTLRPLSLILGIVASASLQAQVPQLINYQGRVVTGGTNFTGTGQFKFALVNGSGSVTYWSNDGSSTGGSQPAAAVALGVSGGLYSVLLGDATLPNMTVVPATVFTNSDVRLRVWFNDGVSGSQLLSPDQRIAAVGYAMMAANVVDGVITATSLANGAVTSAKLADGAVTTAKLASNSVTSVQLDDRLSLGASNVVGELNVYRTSSGTPAISLLGGSSRISTYGSDGEEQIRLEGTTYGELQLNNSLPGNNYGARLSANGSSGGFLRLYNSNGLSRAWLSGANTGGSLTLYQADGGTGAFLDGDDSGSGLLTLGNTNSYTRVKLLGGGAFNGGEIELMGSNGPVRLELFGNAPEVINQLTPSGGGGINIFEGDGTRTISLRGSDEFNTGGELKMWNSAGGLVLDIDTGTTTPFVQFGNGSGSFSNCLTISPSSSSGTAMQFYNNRAATSIALDGDDGGGGFIGVRNTNGAIRLGLDGQGNGGGGEILAYANDGSTGVRVYGDSGGGGYIGLYNTNGSTRLALDGYGNNGGGQVTFYNGAGNIRLRLYGDSGGAGLAQIYNSSGSASIIVDGEDSNGDGRITTDVLEIQGGSDLSERFDIREAESLQPGMVVSIDPENPGSLRLSGEGYDRTVAGIVSGAGGVKPGMLMGQRETKADGKHAVALTGRVYCQADASNGAIRPGDLLTTSDTPGHAMKVTDHARAQGAIIGKAMTSLESGKGLVLVLVSLQ
jgi:hypothetical protein